MRSLAQILAATGMILLGGCDPYDQPAEKVQAPSVDPVLEPPLRTGEAHSPAVRRSAEAE